MLNGLLFSASLLRLFLVVLDVMLASGYSSAFERASNIVKYCVSTDDRRVSMSVRCGHVQAAMIQVERLEL